MRTARHCAFAIACHDPLIWDRDRLDPSVVVSLYSSIAEDSDQFSHEFYSRKSLAGFNGLDFTGSFSLLYANSLHFFNLGVFLIMAIGRVSLQLHKQARGKHKPKLQLTKSAGRDARGLLQILHNLSSTIRICILTPSWPFAYMTPKDAAARLEISNVAIQM